MDPLVLSVFPQFFLLAAGLVLALLFTGCDATEPDAKVVEGVDFDRLFAPASPAEIAAVEADWAGRDVSARDVEEVYSTTLGSGDSASTLRVVSHRVGGVKHYGAVLAPTTAAVQSLPVLLYLHGGDRGIDLGEVMTALELEPTLRRRFVVVVPSFRSETLRLAGRTYASEGPASPWDYDVDDALALLNVALATTPAADPSNVGALGFSRGAAVAMLAAARDPRIGLVVEFFGPTDFQGTFAQQVSEQALRGTLPELPGIGHLNTSVLQPLRRGEIGYDAARLALIGRSPRVFAGRLPQLQVHHGTADTVVPVSEARALDATMRLLGRTAPGYEFYLYEGAGHFPTFDGLARASSFLARLVPADARVAASRTRRPAYDRRW